MTDASFCLSPLRAYMNVLNISFLFLPSLSSTVYGMRLYAHPPGAPLLRLQAPSTARTPTPKAGQRSHEETAMPDRERGEVGPPVPPHRPADQQQHPGRRHLRRLRSPPLSLLEHLITQRNIDPALPPHAESKIEEPTEHPLYQIPIPASNLHTRQNSHIRSKDVQGNSETPKNLHTSFRRM